MSYEVKTMLKISVSYSKSYLNLYIYILNLIEKKLNNN